MYIDLLNLRNFKLFLVLIMWRPAPVITSTTPAT